RFGHAADRYRISSNRQSGPRYRAAWRASEGPAAFSHPGHYALIRRPYNACVPGAGRKLAFNRSKSGLITACTGLAYGVATHGRPLTYPMSVRAEILRLGLRLAKNWHIRERVPLATARRRLRRIESLVPRPPAGTQTTAIEAGGVNAVRVAVRQARSDRCVLYFHGGAYALGTAKLVRDFTWRI